MSATTDDMMTQLQSVLGEQMQTASGMIGQVVEMLQGQGLGGLVEKFKASGLDDTIASWVGKGENLPISTEQIQQLFDADQLSALASKLGIDADTVVAQLKQILPTIVDKLTPDGKLPDAGSLDQAMGMFRSAFGGLFGGKA